MGVQRVGANVLASYAQTLCGILLGIWTVRWCYLALGAEKMGIFSVTGVLFVFCNVINNTLRSSCARFFAYSIGQQRLPGAEENLLRKWFNSAVFIYAVLGLVFAVVLLPVGRYCIYHYLKIPDGMHETCFKIFLLSIASMFYGTALTPVGALYVAKQYIFVRNFFAISLSILMFGEAWWLLHYSGDRLMAHAIITFAVNVVVAALNYLIAYRQFPEMRVRFDEMIDRKRFVELFSFSGWWFFETASFSINGAAQQVIVNKLFGTSANAAMGVGGHVKGKVLQVTDAIISSVTPEISTRMGAGDKNGAIRVAVSSSLLATVLGAFLVVPITVYVGDLMTLWLKTPPPYVNEFICCMLAGLISEKMSTGYIILLIAAGKMKRYSIIMGCCNFLRLGTLALVLWITKSFILALALGSVLPMFFVNQYRAVIAKREVGGIQIRDFFTRILFPVFAIFAVAFSVCLLYKRICGASFPAMLGSGLVNIVVVLGTAWFVVSSEERDFIVKAMRKIAGKFLRKV